MSPIVEARVPGLRALTAVRDDLSGKCVLVTGGSMGIGYACAEEALAAGARVAIAARGADALRAAEERLAGEHGGERVCAVRADVSREADVEALVAAALARLGRLDGLVHAAAVLGPVGPSLEVEPAEWLDALRINLFGTFLVASAVGRAMRPTGGRIVLLSGGGATSAFPNYTAYACGKAAVVRLGESLAAELEPYDIAVNCLAPGFVATRMHEGTLAAGERAGGDYLRRTKEQLEAGGVPAALPGRAAAFLLSDRARGITGKLVSAPWDRWWEWPGRLDELAGSEAFTLRRVVPRDRGRDGR